MIQIFVSVKNQFNWAYSLKFNFHDKVFHKSYLVYRFIHNIPLEDATFENISHLSLFIFYSYLIFQSFELN